MASTTTTVWLGAPAAADLAAFCALPGTGELTPEMVRTHAPDAVLNVTADGRCRARASLWWRRVPAYPGHRVGLVGHYAVAAAEDAARLLDAACAELVRHGCTLAVGPLDGSTWRRYRLLSARGDAPLFFLEPDNPDDWPAHFTGAGFGAFARYYSSRNDDIGRAWEKPPACRLDVNLRPLDTGRLDAEMHVLWQLSEVGFAGNFLYSPIDEAEFVATYRRLLPMVRPEWVLLAEYRGRPAGFVMAVPDLLQVRRGEPLDTVVFKSLAVAPACRGSGLGALLVAEAGRRAVAQGMRSSIHALMHEENLSLRIGGSAMRPFRTYTLYSRVL